MKKPHMEISIALLFSTERFGMGIKMILSRKDLQEYLSYERPLYIEGGLGQTVKLFLLQDSNYLLWIYVRLLRYTEYYCNKNRKFMYWWYQRKKNKLGAKLGISIFHNCIEKGLHIYHYGSIIVNANCKIGEDFKLHGNNCIGNKGGHAPLDVPVIGRNVDVGVGASVLGKVTIGNNVVIGANAVVINNFEEDNTLLLGIPAKVKDWKK